jgi:cell division protein FtsI (penicillin-binding protein 3)
MIREMRLTVLNVALLVFAGALVVRAAYVQLYQGRRWAAVAQRQHYTESSLPAPRGAILDASGVPLAQSQEQVKLAIAPREVMDGKKLVRELSRAGVDRATLHRVTDRKRVWVEVHGTFEPTGIANLLSMTGVHATAVGRRAYVSSEGARKIIGRTNTDGHAVDGLELALDSILRGETGRAGAFRGARGEKYESPSLLTDAPRTGHSVTLTINFTLQDICDRALSEATAQSRADGGDIVVLDPHSGEVRCMASRRQGAKATASTALTEPFEPGSTLKPFFVGALLERGLARTDEMIDTYGGKYTVKGRTITDVHKAGRLSLADVIRFSSNVGIARFTERLSDRQMYETLRDYGFGMPTGVPYPSEAPGILREPRQWSAQSHASLAIGYEIAVTPLQLATAYAALANGGKLMQPALIKAIFDAEGREVYAHQPRVVRQVLKPETAATLRRIMESVVDSGTATDATLTTYNVAGKSGTARRSTGGRYGTGTYTSSFVGLFPARTPQYVVLVKLDNPQGTYYGGKAAAPVAKVVIEAAIAARDAALDQRTLASQRTKLEPVPAAPVLSDQVAADGRGTPDVEASEGGDAPSTIPLVDSVSEPPVHDAESFTVGRPIPVAPRGDSLVTVPAVGGLPLRVAVRALHQSGLRVAVAGDGAGPTSPPAGARVRPGSLVRLPRP